MIRHADIVIDLQAGDTGKGKVSHHLARENRYGAVIRFNGGANAGHTIYHEGKKVVTHQVPVGVFYNIPSIIGPGCVVNLSGLDSELKMLHDMGFVSPVYIDSRCHVTTQEHLSEDSSDQKIGTTRQGIGPTYRDKYNRTGMRIGDLVKYNDYSLPYQLIDIYQFLYGSPISNLDVLLEGAQGFQIDIDWGDYPYVTSSHCTVGSVALNGVAPRYWRNVYGVMKAYETYSGFKSFTNGYENHKGQAILNKIQELGQEFGATTGRKRQVRWLDLDGVIQAMYINNVTDIIINKVDVLDKVGVYGLFAGGKFLEMGTPNAFRGFVEEYLHSKYKPTLNSITWSTSPEKV
jgi:adenylosuccinate synthase